MSKHDECQELKNIKYKTMLLNGVSNVITPRVINTDITNVDKLLEHEKTLNNKEPWSKLDKTLKIRKLDEYVERIIDIHKINTQEATILKKYLATSLDRKKLQRVKDVIYDKNTGCIKSIPSLHFNSTTRKFTLKRSDKRVSTLKSLGGPRTLTRKKNNKIDTNIKDIS